MDLVLRIPGTGQHSKKHMWIPLSTVLTGRLGRIILIIRDLCLTYFEI
jgi:hypothetical protein